MFVGDPWSRRRGVPAGPARRRGAGGHHPRQGGVPHTAGICQ